MHPFYEGFFGLLAKLGEELPAPHEINRAIEQLESVRRNAPTPDEMLAYGGIGAGTGIGMNLLSAAITGGQPFAAAVNPTTQKPVPYGRIRALANAGVVGSIAGGLVPVLRDAARVNLNERKLDSILARQDAKTAGSPLVVDWSVPRTESEEVQALRPAMNALEEKVAGNNFPQVSGAKARSGMLDAPPILVPPPGLEKKAIRLISPMDQLHIGRAAGLPSPSDVKGPSIAKQYKPKGEGTGDPSTYYTNRTGTRLDPQLPSSRPAMLTKTAAEDALIKIAQQNGLASLLDDEASRSAFIDGVKEAGLWDRLVGADGPDTVQQTPHGSTGSFFNSLRGLFGGAPAQAADPRTMVTQPSARAAPPSAGAPAAADNIGVGSDYFKSQADRAAYAQNMAEYMADRGVSQADIDAFVQHGKAIPYKPRVAPTEDPAYQEMVAKARQAQAARQAAPAPAATPAAAPTPRLPDAHVPDQYRQDVANFMSRSPFQPANFEQAKPMLDFIQSGKLNAPSSSRPGGAAPPPATSAGVPAPTQAPAAAAPAAPSSGPPTQAQPPPTTPASGPPTQVQPAPHPSTGPVSPALDPRMYAGGKVPHTWLGQNMPHAAGQARPAGGAAPTLTDTRVSPTQQQRNVPPTQNAPAPTQPGTQPGAGTTMTSARSAPAPLQRQTIAQAPAPQAMQYQPQMMQRGGTQAMQAAPAPRPAVGPGGTRVMPAFAPMRMKAASVAFLLGEAPATKTASAAHPSHMDADFMSATRRGDFAATTDALDKLFSASSLHSSDETKREVLPLFAWSNKDGLGHSIAYATKEKTFYEKTASLVPRAF
jgi:hypothetical protein